MFLPAVLLLYVVTPKKLKNIVLLLTSLVFYAWGSISSLCVLLVFILVNYVLAIYVDVSNGKRRKQRVIEAVVINVVFLAYYKYYGFMLESIFALIPQPPAYELFSIPLGISFFTFSAIAYIVDVYRRKISAEKNMLTFALFIAFFPKLVMGPIECYDSMKKQIVSHPIQRELFEVGCTKFLVGLAQKLILANTMGTIWILCNETQVSLASAWLGILAYAFQIYFDFQGYTQMAIGLGNMFGFHLSQNFRYPYMATSLTDFWRRWHITLSAWFKDYVYIALGGNRTTFDKLLRNLLIVWCLTGIWHGANWNFILWGLYYGVLLIIEKFILVDTLKKLPTLCRWVLTFIAILIGWVFFASNGIGDAFGYLGSMLMLRGNGVVDATTTNLLANYGVYFIICILACTPVVKQLALRFQTSFKAQMWYLKPILTLCCLCILVAFLLSNTYQAFLYFKF